MQAFQQKLGLGLRDAVSAHLPVRIQVDGPETGAVPDGPQHTQAHPSSSEITLVPGTRLGGRFEEPPELVPGETDLEFLDGR